MRNILPSALTTLSKRAIFMLLAHLLAIFILVLAFRTIIADFERAFAGFGVEASPGALRVIKLSHALAKLWPLAVFGAMALDFAIVSLLERRSGWFLDAWAFGFMLIAMLALFALVLMTISLFSAVPRPTV